MRLGVVRVIFQLPVNKRKFSTRLAAVPQQPGVYVHRDKDSNVIYVGKSASLRNRLRSYFGSRKNLDTKTLDLIARIHDFEYIITESEQEALLLENSLIKKYKPKYNVRLKDDKTYPYIKVDLAEDFPRVEADNPGIRRVVRGVGDVWRGAGRQPDGRAEHEQAHEGIPHHQITSSNDSPVGTVAGS